MRPFLKNGKAVLIDGLLTLCDRCPCECVPKVLHRFSVDGRYEGENVYDLNRWSGDGIGFPGGHWRLFELTDQYQYATGLINENGRMIGLPKKFESQYHYRGYIELQQGCPDEFGVVQWPLENGDKNV